MSPLSGENLILKIKDNLPSVRHDDPSMSLSKEQEIELNCTQGNIENTRSSLIKGVKVLGDLIFCYEQNKKNLDKLNTYRVCEIDDISGLGLLIKEVAGIIDGLNFVGSDVTYLINKNEFIKAKNKEPQS